MAEEYINDPSDTQSVFQEESYVQAPTGTSPSALSTCAKKPPSGQASAELQTCPHLLPSPPMYIVISVWSGIRKFMLHQLYSASPMLLVSSGKGDPVLTSSQLSAVPTQVPP